LARQLIEDGQLIGQAFGFAFKVRHSSGELVFQPFLLDVQLLAALLDLLGDLWLIGVLSHLIDCPVPKGSRLTAGVPVNLQFLVTELQLLLHCRGRNVGLDVKPPEGIARVGLGHSHQITRA